MAPVNIFGLKPTLIILVLIPFISASCLYPNIDREVSSQLIIDDVQTISSCWDLLNCTFEEIRDWQPVTRLHFLQYMQATHFQRLGSSDQFRDMEGITEFTMRKGIAGARTWVSHVEAAAIEAVERAAATVLEYSHDTGSNPGVVKWVAFFREQCRGGLGDRREHDQAWSAASLVAIEHGINRAKSANASDPAARELFWVHGLRVHRELMQNRSIIVFFVRAALIFTNKSLAVTIERALEFFTRVNTPVPMKLWSEVVWQVGGILFGYHVEGNSSDWELLRLIAAQFWQEYQKAAKD
ncbi:3-dehydrosphinganine reductase [Paecilomyces lecythidis]|uniref:3-dehydrosphinganine reductase n=1 Tax=Paecilomyces lecythidis TaxID=3004212 RepID=A0ABR3YBS7_9EURO